MKTNTVELQWPEPLWNHEKIFETGLVRANECYAYDKGEQKCLKNPPAPTTITVGPCCTIIQINRTPRNCKLL